MIIAIDGPAAAGKGTLAKRLAQEFNFALLDTGALYRIVGLSLLKAGLDPQDTEAADKASTVLDLDLFHDPALRHEATGQAASQVAAMPHVRRNLLNYQKHYAENPPEGKAGSVLDGRDIGTVVCPNADIKFFVTATAEERACRRTAEIKAKGEDADYETILADVIARDERDTNRAEAPLKPAKDALLLDTTNLDIDAVFLRAVEIIKTQMG